MKFYKLFDKCVYHDDKYIECGQDTYGFIFCYDHLKEYNSTQYIEKNKYFKKKKKKLISKINQLCEKQTQATKIKEKTKISRDVLDILMSNVWFIHMHSSVKLKNQVKEIGQLLLSKGNIKAYDIYIKNHEKMYLDDDIDLNLYLQNFYQKDD